ncbi:MAG: hypothetical protein H0V17_16825 [Deltaproteobacteria bacterium]|nr:hypothetical protein [Deltaproteobacteria bacterium]
MPRALVFAFVVGAVVQAEADRPPTPQLTIEYVAPVKPGVSGAPADHVARMRVLIDMLDRQLQLHHPLTIAFVECGDANAYYRSSRSRVEVCHELWDKRRALYTHTGNGREAVDRRLRSSMTFTMFHEIGHALHDQLKLPLLGSHEDAVDDIATLWMIRLGVGEAARHAAYGHNLRAKQPHYAHDPWDEHGTGAQRGFAIACVLYGSDPERYFGVFEDMNIPAPYVGRCREEYPDRLRAWQTLLGPHLR